MSFEKMIAYRLSKESFGHAVDLIVYVNALQIRHALKYKIALRTVHIFQPTKAMIN